MDLYYREPIMVVPSSTIIRHTKDSVYQWFICQHAGAYVSDDHGWHYYSVMFSSSAS